MTLSTMRIALALVLAGTLTASAQDTKRQTEHQAEHQTERHGKGLLQLLPADAVTQHTIDTPRGKLSYTATAGTLPFYDRSGEQMASAFYTAYVAKDLNGRRPLTFVFNGGPGAASAFLHLGMVGPRILDLGPDGRDAARAELRDNPDTWLAFTDLVFIDPVGTGWSRTAKSDDGKHFWNVRADAESIAKAIALYVAHNNRASAPKYLFGESYGGFRAAKVARALQREQGLALSGIVMLSPMLEGWLTFGDNGSALRAALQLPSLAAANLERNNAYSPAALAEAEKFALTDYLTAMAGPTPQGEAGRAFYERLAKVTGLPLDAVTHARGFVADDFVKSLHNDGKIVSRYDANFAVDDPFPEARVSHGNDPILDAVSRAYGGAFAAYARNELGFKTEMTYALLASDVTKNWDWDHGRVQADAENDLRLLLAYGPSFRLLIAHGVADMVTPYAMTRYVLDHMPPTDPPGRVQLKLYRGGHMLYLDRDSRKAFTSDAAAFFRAEE